ncbi:hypothetical protein HK100_003082 [Physocladia obscura]|uniref:Uncharacterized protein n=1 Tax=Physocladia obscura TaxID=109957 RepID=A0AAD5T0F5_9FUNG|nr:hypothetical protein HK100_003082 [Physocladia obscura]
MTLKAYPRGRGYGNRLRMGYLPFFSAEFSAGFSQTLKREIFELTSTVTTIEKLVNSHPFSIITPTIRDLDAKVALNDALLENLLTKGNSFVEAICVSVDSIPVGTRISDDVPGNGDCGFAAVGCGSGHSALTLRQESNNVIHDNLLSFQAELIPETPADYTHQMSKFAISGENG